MTLADWAWLIPALPALAAAVGLPLGRRLPGGPAPTAVLATAVATALAIAMAAQVLAEPAGVTEHRVLLTPTGGLAVSLGTRVDALAAVVAVMVCVVALLVQVYSTAYLRGDPRYSSYVGLVSLFTAAMLLVVFAADLVLLLVGWEVMGACSYFLIGHYYQTPSACAAAVKAFLTTRIGDVGFTFGIFVLGVSAGSFAVADVLATDFLAADGGRQTATVATLLLACGVVGKSAQFPLHTWLPDAMAGPTPISALIHAATMVAAGIYVVARLYPVFVAAPLTLDVLGVVAAVTMLLGGLAALAQDDLKRVLAYSTISQLAYMLGALAVGGYAAAIFHLLSHAAFKALLFLAAGSVLHAVGTNLMSEMGGLSRRMPVTFAATLVGAAAMVGLPPLSGALSKDAVLAAAYDAGPAGNPVVPVSSAVATTVWVAGLLTVVLTAAYLTRMIVLVFLGRPRAAAQPHEAPVAMTGPVVLLAAAAAVLGVLALPGLLPEWLAAPGTAPVEVADLHVAVGPVLLTTAILAAASVAVWSTWRRRRGDPLVLLGRAWPVLANGFYLDDLYGRVIVKPVRGALTGFALGVDANVLDGTVDGAGRGARALGAGLRRLQNGNVQAYATGVVIGVLALSIALATR